MRGLMLRDRNPGCLLRQEVGCAEEVDTGVTPNEYGTWLYGRDGWCNGRDVFPWIVDVTDDVADGTSASGSNTLSYTAVWCPNATYFEPPNPGPPSTWSQAPPVAMVSIFLVCDGLCTAPAPPRHDESPSTIELVFGIGGGSLLLVLLAMVAGLCVCHSRRARKARSSASASSGPYSPALLDDPVAHSAAEYERAED